MKFSVKTDKGIARSSNQDACFAGFPDGDSCFAVVCDGMGGANAGDIASDIAVSVISKRVLNGWRKGIKAESVENLITSAVSVANICIYDEAVADKEKRGMGTTVVAAAVTGRNCVVAHVGDSRAYLVGSELRRLTHDHSYVQMLVDRGLLTESEADVHPKKNYLTRVLGVSEHIDIDFETISLNTGDKLVLCSDGLTNYVSEDDIFNTVSAENADSGTAKLIDMANDNGGGDNISVIVIEV